MAKVFADDAVLNYTGTQKFLALTKTKVYDNVDGNNNGRLDPGETANLTAFLKNIGGAAFSALNSAIQCSDPYITVNDNSGYFGAIAIDATKENTADPYRVTVSGSAPTGHGAQFRLIASETGFADTFDFSLTIGAYHYLVWNPDPTPDPGLTIHNTLTAMGYNGHYSTALPAEADLGQYMCILACIGIYPNNVVVASNGTEATALTSYLNSGGRLYMEGGDMWYYDPLYMGGHDFGPAFGLSATADGSADGGPYAGQSGTFTNGMNFTYAGENSFMDHISPSGAGAFLIFTDTDNIYDASVANDVGTYRTVGASFELGSLVDGTGNSTKAALLDSILHFFGIGSPVGVDEKEELTCPSTEFSLKVYPSIAKRDVRIGYSIGHSAKSGVLEIYDASGRIVRSFTLGPSSATPYGGSALSILWHGSDNLGNAVPAGIYFVHLETADQRVVEKVILVK